MNPKLLIDRHPLLLKYILVCCCFMLQSFIFLNLYDVVASRWTSTLLPALSDGLLMSLPFVFLPPRWRRRTLWPVAVVFTLYCLSEAVYLRNFSDFYNLNVLYSGNILDSLVINTTLHSFRLSDLLLLATPVIMAVIFRFLPATDGIFTRKLRLTACVVTIIAPLLCWIFSARRLYYWEVKDFFQGSPAEQCLQAARLSIVRLSHPIILTTLCGDLGVVPLAAYTASTIIPDTHTLTDAERQQIERFMSVAPPQPDSLYATAMKANSDKSLILIIVESLNTTALTDPLAADMTPTLLRLAGDSSSVTALEVMSQIGPGESSDGQFMYNTGLLPLRNLPLVSNYAEADYPSLAKALGRRNSVEVIGEQRRVWNHDLTSRSYGYTGMFDKICADIGIDEDSLILSRAAAIADSLPQPFFMAVTTITMHTPYNKTRVSRSAFGGDRRFDVMEARDRVYAERLHHFDRSLNMFIKALRQSGRLDNTVIAIVGDHPATEGYLSPRLECASVPLIIYNAGISVRSPRQITQVDVFPTLLDIMSVPRATTGDPLRLPRYRGMGTSLLAAPPANDRRAEAWDISSLIIRSRLYAQ